ncbi:MAG: tetratricopeptide (TPR) repeat protein [Sphingobacteriales bacterium]
MAEYQILYSKINYIFRIGGFVKSDEEKAMVDEISRHPLIINEDAPLSIRAESVRYYVKGFCSNAYRDYATSLKNFEKVKDLLDEHPHLRKDLGKRYLRSLINIIMGYLNKKNFKKANELTAELETIQSKPGFNTLDIQFMVFSAQYIAKLVLLIRTGEFEEGVKLIPQIAEEIESDRKVNKEQKLIFYYIISYIYFGAERYKEALQWINKVLNDNENTLRQDIYSYARIFNLVIHYELGNYDLLEYIIKSTSRYLNKKDREYKIETLLIEYIKRFSKLSEGDQKQTLYIELREELDEHFKESSERVILEYFDFKAWILAKIDGVGFREMVIRRNIHKE